MEQLPNSVRRTPQLKDWNLELMNYLNFEQQQQQKIEQKRSRGLSL
ncbi:MAG: hypothetical protein ACYTXA_07445 [Nostoc sp.]